MDNRPVVAITDGALAETESKVKKGGERAQRAARHAIAILFWCYVVLKLFVFDVDTVIVRRFLPQATWLLHYKAVVLLAILAMLATVAWNRRLLGWAVYVAFYPFILVLWHLPAWLVRRRAWVLSVAMAAAVVSAVRALRSTIILAALFAVGALFIAVGVSPILLWAGMAAMALFIIAVYSRTIRESFRSSLNVFTSRSLDRIWSVVSKGFTLSAELKELNVHAMTESQRSTWTTNLQMSILYGRGCYFVADKLRTLRQERITAAIVGIKVAGLFLATVAVFSLLNYGLYQADPGQYALTRPVRAFDFLWYAFQASFMSGIPQIAPVGVLARSVFMANEITSGLILFVVVVFFLTSVQTARNADQMDAMICNIRDHARTSEQFVMDQFGLTIGAAVSELMRLRAGMIDWILRLAPELRPGGAQDTADDTTPVPSHMQG